MGGDILLQPDIGVLLNRVGFGETRLLCSIFLQFVHQNHVKIVLCRDQIQGILVTQHPEGTGVVANE